MPASDQAQLEPRSNNPPLAESARMSIEEQLAALQPRKDELLDSLGRAKCTNADEAGKCADLTKALKKLGQKADAIRKDVKEPYQDAGKAVDAAAKSFCDAILEGELKLRQMLTGFERAERERQEKERREREAREREERERVEAARRAEAEAAKAAGAETPAPPPESEPEPEPEPERRRPVAAGDYGASAHRREVTVLEVEDVYALPPEVLTAPDVTEAILKVCRRMRSANPEIWISGLIVKKDVAVTIR